MDDCAPKQDERNRRARKKYHWLLINPFGEPVFERFWDVENGPYFIYVLKDSITLEVRYVGCCHRPTERYNLHLLLRSRRRIKSTPLETWKVRNSDLWRHPIMEVVQKIVGHKAAIKAESDLIHDYAKINGARLLNRKSNPLWKLQGPRDAHRWRYIGPRHGHEDQQPTQAA